jgi:predicted metal-dependent phosphoesterase TrpH
VRVDLHIHSTASDGRWPPQELVTQVKRAGIELFAVTDHDTIANVLPVERLARGSGLGFIRAVEVSATLQGHLIHIAAYGVDLDDPALLHMLDENGKKLRSAGDQSIEKLIHAGYDVTWEEFKAYENDVTRGGWKALNFTLDKGICRDVPDFFGRLFVGDMALVYPSFAAPQEAVRTIHQAGGIAIWAHPGNDLYKEGGALSAQLLGCGMDGLECYSPYHDKATTQRCLDFCRRHDLLVTAGSDCHGGFVGRALGVPQAHSADLKLGPLLDHVIR